jgi:hypothetical protein
VTTLPTAATANQPGHIFLSYRSLEAQFALKLAADLKNRGVRVWLDRLETGIKGGDDWRRAIEQAVNTCAAMICALSPDYVRSEYCRNEMARANRLGRPLLPVLVAPVPGDEWPIEIERIHYVDFRDWQDEGGYSAQFDALLTILREKASAQFASVPDTETQYLTSLIAELEARRGVIEYVDLRGQTDAPNADPAERPNPHGEIGWNAEFTLLLAGSDPAMPAADSAERNAASRVALTSIREATTQHPRFTLIGEPGAGKTTTLRRLALEAARARLEAPRTAPLPVLLFLPQWGAEPDPFSFIKAHYPLTPDLLAAGLKRGDVQLYLDGLNEMGVGGAEKAATLRSWLHNAADPHADSAPKYAVITCRAADYAGALDLALPTVLAEPMGEVQSRQFASNYLGERAEAFLNQLFPAHAAESSTARHLSPLADNPYMLAALIFIFANVPGGELPRNAGALFRSLARALWERERQKQTPGWVPFEQMEAAFARLAYAMIDEDKPIDVPLDYARRHVGDEALLKAGRSASLIDLRGGDQAGDPGSVRFYHQLMQEYFAAAALLPTRLAEKITAPVFGYGGRLPNKWDESVVALCGLFSDASQTVSEIMGRDAWLAARCVAGGARVNDDTRAALVRTLISALTRPDWSARASAARALGLIPDPASVEPLRGLLNDEALYVVRSARKSLNTIEELLTDSPPMVSEGLDEPDEPIVPMPASVKAAAVATSAATPPAPPAPVEYFINTIPKRVGDYELTALIGRGAMGMVFEAQHTLLPRTVAIKVIDATTSAKQRAQGELGQIAQLNHPHLLPLLDFGSEGRYFYLVTERVMGSSLATLLRTQRPPLDTALRLFEQLASAVNYLHQHQILHRDIRPQNVLLDKAGNAFLSDTGLTKLFVRDLDDTAAGGFVGTPAYLAPEQWQGVGVSAQTDIYALGIVLFELLTGRVPFMGDTPYAVMNGHVNQPPPSVTALQPAVPAAYDEVIQKALAKRPDQRHQTANEMLTALRGDKPPEIERVWPVATVSLPQAAAPKGGSDVTLIVVGLILAALIVVAVIWWFVSR